MVAHRDHPQDQARALAQEALAAWRGADPDHALEACEHALTLLLPVGASDALADVLRWKGSILRDRGSHSAASDLYAQSLAVADSIGYQSGRAHALNCLGTIAQFRGDLPASERWYGEAARMAHRLGERRLAGMVQQNLGIVADVQGRTDEAIAHFRLALVAFEQEDQRDSALLVLNNLGLLYTRERSFARAEEVLDRALGLAKSVKDVVAECVIEENRALLFLTTDRIDMAESATMRAMALADQRRDTTRRAAALRLLSRIARVRDGNVVHALNLLERGLALCELGEDTLLRTEILSDLGDAYRDAGESGRAKETWRRALEIARLAGYGGLTATLQMRLRPSLGGVGEASQAIVS